MGELMAMNHRDQFLEIRIPCPWVLLEHFTKILLSERNVLFHLIRTVLTPCLGDVKKSNNNSLYVSNAKTPKPGKISQSTPEKKCTPSPIPDFPKQTLEMQACLSVYF